MIRPPAPLRPLLELQKGLLTREQLYAHGISAAQIRWALGRHWRLVHRNVFATFTGHLDGLQTLIAAQLFAGAEAQITSLTSAAWLNIESAPRDATARFVTSWTGESRDVPGVSVRRTRRPDAHPVNRDPLVFAGPARTIVDACRAVRGDAVLAILFEGVQRRLTTFDALHHELEAGATRGSAETRAGLHRVAGGGWSLPEAEFLDLLASSRILPTVVPNPVLLDLRGRRLPCPDGYVPDVGLALQVHSRRHHLFEEDWRWTLRRDTALGAAGVPLMAFVPTEFRQDPKGVLVSIENAYEDLVRRAALPAAVVETRGSLSRS